MKLLKFENLSLQLKEVAQKYQSQASNNISKLISSPQEFYAFIAELERLKESRLFPNEVNYIETSLSLILGQLGLNRCKPTELWSSWRKDGLAGFWLEAEGILPEKLQIEYCNRTLLELKKSAPYYTMRDFFVGHVTDPNTHEELMRSFLELQSIEWDQKPYSWIGVVDSPFSRIIKYLRNSIKQPAESFGYPKLLVPLSSASEGDNDENRTVSIEMMRSFLALINQALNQEIQVLSKQDLEVQWKKCIEFSSLEPKEIAQFFGVLDEALDRDRLFNTYHTVLIVWRERIQTEVERFIPEEYRSPDGVRVITDHIKLYLRIRDFWDSKPDETEEDLTF